jgi:hypothetical protein
MEDVWGSGGIGKFLLNLQRYMNVSVQILAQGKLPPVAIGQEAEWVPDPAWKL